MYSRDRSYAGLAILTIVILAGSLVYYYSTATAQISSLKSDGRTLCTTFTSVANSVYEVYSNTTQTMQQQIQEDNSIITTLNSTKPSGYAGMIATLQAEETQDLAIVTSMNNLLSVSTSSGPCPASRSIENRRADTLWVGHNY